MAAWGVWLVVGLTQALLRTLRMDLVYGGTILVLVGSVFLS
jgi:hypothetical protein